MKPILFFGKMRLICTSLLLFLIFHTNLFSQEVDCGIQTLDYSLAEATKYGDGNATRLHKALSSNYNIKVAVHIVGFANGTGGLSSNDASASVGQVTSNFNRTFGSEGINFNFQVISIDYLYDDNLMSLDNASELQQLFDKYTQPGVLHVIYVSTANGAKGWSDKVPGSKIIVQNNAALNNETFTHEVGHLLGLYHTFQIWTKTEDGIKTTLKEHVCRNVSDSKYNALTAGDLLHDTPANPMNCTTVASKEIQNFGIDNCTFSNNYQITDEMGDLYADPSNILIPNFMSASYKPYVTCNRTQFTYDQIHRMLAYLDNDPCKIVNTESVEFANAFNGQTITDLPNRPSKLTVDGEIIPSGTSRYLKADVTHNVKTNQERFNDFQPQVKHQNWDLKTEEYTLSKDFSFHSGASYKRTANFVGMNPVTLLVKVEGLTVPSLKMEFKDPWYVFQDGKQKPDQSIAWTEFTSGGKPTGAYTASTGGVFLNRAFDPIYPNKPYYSVRALKNLSSVTYGSMTFPAVLGGWSTTNAQVTTPFNLVSDKYESPVVITGTNAVIQADYKGLHLSNFSNAFVNSGQKKTKSDGANTILVYESMNSIWMENSVNMGSSWTFLNSSTPINPSGTAKDPSIDGTDDASHFYIVGYAAPDAATNTTKIMASEIDASRVTGTKTLINNIPGSTFDAQPVVACLDAYTGSGPSITQKAIMIWRQPAMTGGFGEALPAGLYYKTGTVTQKPDPVLPYLMVNEISWEPYDVGTYIAGTDINSFNPTVAGVRSTNTIPMVFHVAYSEKIRSNYSSVIKYTSLTLNSDGTVSQSSTQEISDPIDSYNQLNEKPSITLVNNLPYVAWKNYSDATYMQTAVLRWKTSASAWSGTYYYAGKDDDATSVHISNTGNMSTGYTSFVMGWNTSYSGDQFVKSSSLSTIYNSNKNGNGIQVMGGSRNDFTDSYLISYSNSSLPYSFMSSNAIPLGTLAKVSSDGEGRTVEERSGLIKLNNFFIKASLGDLTFNGNKVGFKEPKDTLGNSLEYFKGSLESESINAANGGILTYTAGYEYSDSLKALSFLKEGSHAGLSVELIDAETGLVLKKLNSFTLSPSSPTKEHAQSFRLDLSGIGMKKVALRLSSDLDLKDSTKAEYYVLRHYAVQRKARKDNFVDLKYSEGARVTEYGLSQNYPNPFNPSTVINFQIPQASKVMLKVYDMLGKEVTTLVNEYKEQGRYSVEFNASSLPSGTYIYEIRANNFVKSGKMMLLK